MLGARGDPAPPRPKSLDSKAADEWLRLAGQTVRERLEPWCSNANVTLEAAAEREPQSPAAPAYRLWTADNLARDGRYADAVAAYDRAVAASQSARRLLATHDPTLCALHHKAQAAALAGSASIAVRTYEELARHAPDHAPDALFRAGLIAEASGEVDRAAELYEAVAGKTPSTRAEIRSEDARRARLRLEDAAAGYASDPRKLADWLEKALEKRDAAGLKRLASSTHFTVGPVGGHAAYEDLALLDALCRDLLSSPVSVRRHLLGSGGKRYLPTGRWNGTWFRGDVFFVITKSPRGWHWTGLGISSPNDLWLERWRPPKKRTNQPLPFELFAPWPAFQTFMAGGLNEYLGQQAAVVAAGWPGGALLALVFARSGCGFGPRGFYYNQWPTHDEDDAFAIDFTRYRRYVPYDNESGGTPVLAVRAGIVSRVDAGAASGDPDTSNTVHIEHADPANAADLSRFTSRYLHLAGPFDILVSEMMPIFLGNRIGRMDDTGKSLLDHLHFSIHDRNIAYPGVPWGASVRPTPMSGVTLGDGDSGTCVRSTNVEYVGEKPMKEITTFAGQNWLITPAATAANQTPPARIQDQTWLLVLSGVGIVDLKGISAAQWLRETISMRPDLDGPLQYAIGRYAIPTPPGTDGANYRKRFQVEQWVPFAAVSSMFNRNESVNSGFAVDVWRPNPFGTGTDSFTSAPVNNLFAGIQVDVAVRDSDAWLYRVSYHIALLGKIAFTQVIIT